jgi:hypothetical protein
MKGEKGSLDSLIIEMLSYDLYKRGKEPLAGIDPKERIKRSVWLDEGVDLDLLSGKGIVLTDGIRDLGIFKLDEIEVKEGLLRRRKRHGLMIGPPSLGAIQDLIGSINKNDRKTRISEILRSEILFPLVLTIPFGPIRAELSDLKVERRSQKEMPDISPRSAVRNLMEERRVVQGEDDLRRSFERTVPERFIIRTKNGSRIGDIKSMISVIMGSRDEELSSLIASGRLLELARDGLRSPRLEGMISDLSKDATGSPEIPAMFKARLGRMMMTSEISGDIFEKVIVPLLERFRTCSEREASRLMKELEYLMDLRSSPLMKELVFDVPSGNRPYLISLMGETRDRNLKDTLERISDYSTLEPDRDAAGKALRSLGEE